MNQPDREKLTPHPIRTVVINSGYHSNKELFDDLEPYGFETIGAYTHPRNVKVALEAGTFPQADLIITGILFINEEGNLELADKLAKKIRAAGIDAPIVAVDTFAGITVENVLQLEEAGAIVHPDEFRLGSLTAGQMAQDLRHALGHSVD